MIFTSILLEASLAFSFVDSFVHLVLQNRYLQILNVQVQEDWSQRPHRVVVQRTAFQNIVHLILKIGNLSRETDQDKWWHTFFKSASSLPISSFIWASVSFFWKEATSKWIRESHECSNSILADQRCLLQRHDFHFQPQLAGKFSTSKIAITIEPHLFSLNQLVHRFCRNFTLNCIHA